MTLTKELNQAKRDLEKARKAWVKLSDQHHATVEVPRRRKAIGKCFKYRNSYGPGQDWWMYQKVVGVDAEGFYEVLQIQRDCRGHVSCQVASCHDILNSSVPITLVEFNSEARPLLKFLNELSGMSE